jgi:diguanylate cyclase (GGDEF)-like protein
MARTEDRPLAQARVAEDVQVQLRRLAGTLLERTEEVIEAVTARAHGEREREGGAELEAAVEERFVGLGRLATAGVARWLGGEPVEVASAAGEEFSQVFAQLAAGSHVPMGEVVRRCRCWREACEGALRDAAGEGPAADEALERACGSIRAAADRALAQMSAVFDEERRRVKAKLSFLATHDGLTRLANRALVRERLERMLARSARRGGGVSVLFIDLDEFKLVNDTLGHHAGDRLLVAIAGRLQRMVRESDTLGRLGGDEFVILAEGGEAGSGPGEMAKRVGGAFGEPFALQGHSEPLRLSASIGVAVAGPGASAEQLLRDADTAMYRAKDSRNGSCVRYEPGMELSLARRADAAAQKLPAPR